MRQPVTTVMAFAVSASGVLNAEQRAAVNGEAQTQYLSGAHVTMGGGGKRLVFLEGFHSTRRVEEGNSTTQSLL
jgi:hypothetical protein